MKLNCLVGQRPYVLPAQGAALWIKEKNDPVSGPSGQSFNRTIYANVWPVGPTIFSFNLSLLYRCFLRSCIDFK
jgi:hypothetical protein